MKNLVILFSLLLIASCNQSNKHNGTISDNILMKNDSNIVLINGNIELSPVDKTILIIEDDYQKGDNALDYLKYLSSESKNTDCYLIDIFIEDDLIYAVVDFVTVKETTSINNPDDRTIIIENKSKKLRTFTADLEYFKCGHSEKVLLDDLLSLPKNTVLQIDVVNGAIKELFLDTCSG